MSTKRTAEDRYHSCLRKRRYMLEETAAQAAQRLKDDHGGEIHHYRCDYGDHWHVGHKRRRELCTETSLSP